MSEYLIKCQNQNPISMIFLRTKEHYLENIQIKPKYITERNLHFNMFFPFMGPFVDCQFFQEQNVHIFYTVY